MVDGLVDSITCPGGSHIFFYPVMVLLRVNFELVFTHPKGFGILTSHWNGMSILIHTYLTVWLNSLDVYFSSRKL